MQQNMDYQCLKAGTGRCKQHSSSHSTVFTLGRSSTEWNVPLKAALIKPKSPQLSSSGFHTSLFPEWVPQLQNVDLSPFWCQQSEGIPSLHFPSSLPSSSSHKVDKPSSDRSCSFHNIQLQFRTVSKTASSISTTLPGLSRVSLIYCTKWMINVYILKYNYLHWLQS